MKLQRKKEWRGKSSSPNIFFSIYIWLNCIQNIINCKIESFHVIFDNLSNTKERGIVQIHGSPFNSNGNSFTTNCSFRSEKNVKTSTKRQRNSNKSASGKQIKETSDRKINICRKDIKSRWVDKTTEIKRLLPLLFHFQCRYESALCCQSRSLTLATCYFETLTFNPLKINSCHLRSLFFF